MGEEKHCLTTPAPTQVTPRAASAAVPPRTAKISGAIPSATLGASTLPKPNAAASRGRATCSTRRVLARTTACMCADRAVATAVLSMRSSAWAARSRSLWRASSATSTAASISSSTAARFRCTWIRASRRSSKTRGFRARSSMAIFWPLTTRCSKKRAASRTTSSSMASASGPKGSPRSRSRVARSSRFRAAATSMSRIPWR